MSETRRLDDKPRDTVQDDVNEGGRSKGSQGKNVRCSIFVLYWRTQESKHTRCDVGFGGMYRTSKWSVEYKVSKFRTCCKWSKTRPGKFRVVFGLLVAQCGGGLTFTFACVHAQALFDGTSQQSIDTLDRTRALACTCGRVLAACVSSPRDGGVSIGSQTKQHIDISQALPRLAHCLLHFRQYTSETSIKKLANSVPERWLFLVRESTRVHRTALSNDAKVKRQLASFVQAFSKPVI